MAEDAAMTVEQGRRSVAKTAGDLAAALARRHVQLFARIDHAGAAQVAGLDLAGEQVLIFGGPRVGG